MSFSFLALLLPRRYLSVVVPCTNYNRAREPALYPYCKQLLPLIATTVASSGAVCLCCKCAAHESQICRRINFVGPTVVTAAFVFLPSLLQWLFSDFFLFFCNWIVCLFFFCPCWRLSSSRSAAHDRLVISEVASLHCYLIRRSYGSSHTANFWQTQHSSSRCIWSVHTQMAALSYRQSIKQEANDNVSTSVGQPYFHYFIIACPRQTCRFNHTNRLGSERVGNLW